MKLLTQTFISLSLSMSISLIVLGVLIKLTQICLPGSLCCDLHF